MTTKLINDNFQNFKRYGIPKAQLVIANIPYNQAKERMVELLKETMDTTDTRETFEIKSVEFNQNIDECLGGHIE